MFERTTAMEDASDNAPPIPVSIAETGISDRNLLYLMLKFMHIEACETILDLAEQHGYNQAG